MTNVRKLQIVLLKHITKSDRANWRVNLSKVHVLLCLRADELS